MFSVKGTHRVASRLALYSILGRSETHEAQLVAQLFAWLLLAKFRAVVETADRKTDCTEQEKRKDCIR